MNEISNLPVDAFAGPLPLLQAVDLSDNALSSLPDGIFKDLGGGDGGSLYTM